MFPAMRTLAIKSADGFILVCAADDPPSLEVHAISRVALFPLDDFPKNSPYLATIKDPFFGAGSHEKEIDPSK